MSKLKAGDTVRWYSSLGIRSSGLVVASATGIRLINKEYDKFSRCGEYMLNDEDMVGDDDTSDMDEHFISICTVVDPRDAHLQEEV